MRQIAALSHSGCSYVFACPNVPVFRARVSASVPGVSFVDMPHRSLSFVHIWTMLKLIHETRGPIVVHSHGRGAGAYSKIICLAARCVVIHTPHGCHFAAGAHRWFQRLVEGVGILLSGCTLFVSKSEQIEFMGTLKYGATMVIPNGVAPPLSSVVADVTRRVDVYFVGRDNWQKDPVLALFIARQLIQRCGNESRFRFHFFGEGLDATSDFGRTAIKALGSAVVMHGIVADVWSWGSPAFILNTSRWEGMSLALLEGMVRGAVPVATDVSGNRDVVRRGANGFLFSRDAPDSAVDWIWECVRDQQCYEMLRRSAIAQVLQNHSIERVAANVEKVYTGLLSLQVGRIM
ncbi:glycosyltransferase family 4 protein [Opitutus terrae]|uniref:Glycosyl transferase group 1 n=1 Tax=Opitutus terrae (strain DSM 11246 / JCM 15787 / PB90-1) TaxID=452637 RepID=B1ZV63_OPITP|nr:glycosyl transferase group 1 [Opitutus terrae PB90-1]